MGLVNNYPEQGMVDLVNDYVNNYLQELQAMAKNCSTQWHEMKQ